VLRSVYGEYRAPTGVGRTGTTPGGSNSLAELRERVDGLSAKLGRRLTMLVGKPGLDGHSNGAEQVAVRARDCGFAVIYDGIRLTPRQIADAAAKEGAHIVGLSILSGSHVTLVEEVVARLREAGVAVPVIVGGIIPAEDEARLKAAGVARVYTPKDFDLTQIMREIVEVVAGTGKSAA
jgi:(2R)-ethylmalonyl-CoA mutase